MAHSPANKVIAPGSDILGPGHTIHTVTEQISEIVLTKKTGKGWLIGFGISFMVMNLMLVSIGWLLLKGVGVWGNNVPVAWAFDITNFVWWIGIGHAGTLISAILLLLRQEWRTSINRFAEAMTLFAVACAGLFPLLHVGRPWLAYWLFPYPNTMGMWPQWRSPLEWDVFAVSTYFTISLLFWYVGLIPDLATMRDRARNKLIKIIYGLGAMGWRGSARHWHRYEVCYLLLAGLATPLVISVHTVVSFDFAVSQLPGWHATIFPPYFVAGAIFAGFAMVLTLCIPLRAAYGLKDFITDRHLNNMAKVMLATGLIVAYGYLMEIFMAFYGGNTHEAEQFLSRFQGRYMVFFWCLILFNILIPQAAWFKAVRSNPYALFMVAMSVNVGMWLERFVIIVNSLYRNHMPSMWREYAPTFWDFSLFFGTIGFFFTLLFLFLRFLPVISVFEMRELVSRKGGEHVEPSATTAGSVEA
jgi:Ni/Fe-hydrogenase subunit HybB-like protein